MNIKQTKAYQWFYALFHLWTIAKLCQQYAVLLGHGAAVNELTRNGVIVSMRGSVRGWSATVGKRFTFDAPTMAELLHKIAEAE